MTKLKKRLNELRLEEIAMINDRVKWLAQIESGGLDPFLRMLCRDRVNEHFDEIFRTLSIQIKTLEGVQE